MGVHMKTRHFPTQRQRHIDLIHNMNALICVEMSQVASNMHVGWHWCTCFMNKYRPELHQYAAWRNPSALTHTNIPHTCTGGAGKLNHMDYDVVKRTVKDFEMGLWEEKDWGRACFEIRRICSLT